MKNDVIKENKEKDKSLEVLYAGLDEYIKLAKSMGIDKNDLVEIFKNCMEASEYKTHKQD